MVKILCVIPSRMQSTRLPNKPLLPIQGKPMVQWTYENACRCSLLAKVIVATDHPDIAAHISKLHGEVMMTDSNIATGTERVAVVAKHYPDMDVVINLQGDEPFVTPAMLATLVKPYLDDEQPEMTTLAYPLSKERYEEPGAVKVITDLNGHALYFSRSPIPYYRTQYRAPVYNHMGIYAFRYDFLMQYATLPQTPLEMTESLEQLRALEHGYKIKVCLTDAATLEVNTQEEYELAQRFNYTETITN